LRVFAGLPLSSEVKRDIGAWISETGNKYKGLKFVKPDLLHLTLYFFGEIDTEKTEELKAAVKSIKCSAAEVSLGSISCFPSFRKPNVFYISLSRGSRKVRYIHDCFTKCIKQLGYMVPVKDFVPHITLARRKKKYINEDWDALKNRNFNIDNIVFDEIILYRSVLKPEGPEYYPLASAELEQ
jgi:RNA 2',3'-cyclic 3'-phosphodiesterase